MYIVLIYEYLCTFSLKNIYFVACLDVGDKYWIQADRLTQQEHLNQSEAQLRFFINNKIIC